MQCPACKKLVQGDFKFCPNCGNKINSSCLGCGKEMLPEWVACPYCGLAASTPTAPQPPTNPQYSTSHHHQAYYSGSSGHHRRRKGLLGSFFSS